MIRGWGLIHGDPRLLTHLALIQELGSLAFKMEAVKREGERGAKG